MKKTAILFLLSSVFVGTSALAGGHVGGGDPCKNEIDKDRLAILGWIQRDEAKELDFSLARVSGWTYNDPSPAKSYRSSMLSVLQEGKVAVTCYLDPARISDPTAKKVAEKEGVSYKAITIGSPPEPVTCINYEDGSGVSHIDCNYDLVMASTSLGSPDYVTVHHEYASIAGVEARTDSLVSDFSVSNQLSQYEHWQTVKVLGPKKVSTLSPFCFGKISDLVTVLSNECFSVLKSIPNPIVTDSDQIKRNAITLDFNNMMQEMAGEWKEGFGKTCAGPDAQDACLDRCKQLGYLDYCFKNCSQF